MMALQARRITPIHVFVAVTLVVVALGIVGEVVHHHIRPFQGIRLALRLNSEANLPTWWNAMLLLTGAGLAGLTTSTVRRAGRSRAELLGWAAVTGALVTLSLDEAVQVHERLALLAPLVPSTPSYQWVVPGALVAVVGLTCLAAASRTLPREVRRGLAVAAALYLGGAVGVESFNGWLAGTRGIGDLYRLSTALEESLEMAGCLVAIATLLGGLRGAGQVVLPAGRRVALVVGTVWLLVVGAALAVALLLPVDPDARMGYHVLLWREGNTTTWIQAGVWWFAAATFVLAARRGAGPRPSALVAVAGVAALISVSEMGRVHELVGRVVGPLGLAWEGPLWAPVVLAAALAVVVALRLARAHLPDPLAWRLTAAVALLSIGAVGGELLDARLADDGPFSLRVIVSTISETTELLAALYVMVTALALANGAVGPRPGRPGTDVEGAPGRAAAVRERG